MPTITLSDGTEFTLDPHASQRMLERGVSESWIRRTLESPDEIGTDEELHDIYRKSFSTNNRNYLIHVVIDTEYNWIITVIKDITDLS
jgi:hypothetical protein